jgi:hypothetical protein
MLKPKMKPNHLLYINDNIHQLAISDRIVGYYLSDRYNESVARIEALLAQPITYLPRYAVITIGGFLGVEGKHILIPIELCEEVDIGKVKTNWSKESLKDAPTAVDVRQVSVEEEERILSYFDFEPYWKIQASPNNKKGAEETPMDI